MTFRRRSFQGIEVALLDCTGHAFAKHAHDEFVVGANLVGRERIWLDGRTHEAERAQVTLYNPGQVQSADAGQAPWAFVSFYLDPQAVVRITGLPSETVFERPILQDQALDDLVRTLGAHALDQAVYEGDVLEGVSDLLGRLFGATGTRQPAVAHRLRPEVRRTAERLLDDMSAPPRLEDLAALEGLTCVQLVRAFARAYALPPFAWLNVERLKAARRGLARGERLADLAVALGFADQAHLTRRFKAMYGMPPAAWARGGR